MDLYSEIVWLRETKLFATCDIRALCLGTAQKLFFSFRGCPISHKNKMFIYLCRILFLSDVNKTKMKWNTYSDLDEYREVGLPPDVSP